MLCDQVEFNDYVIGLEKYQKKLIKTKSQNKSGLRPVTRSWHDGQVGSEID